LRQSIKRTIQTRYGFELRKRFQFYKATVGAWSEL